METIRWDLRGQVPTGFEVQNLTTVEVTKEGVYVETTNDGFIQLPPLTQRVDALRMTVTNAQDAETALMWHTTDLAPGEYYQSPFVMPAGERKIITIALHQIPEWTWSAPFIGIAFPAGSRLLIEDIEWHTYTPWEKFWNGFVSFWTPDQFRLYSINFLWGPLIGATPEARTDLFETLPPKSWSATRIFYGIFIVAAVIAGLLAWVKPTGGHRRFITIIAVTGAVLWALFDIRMTQEILSYVADDWRTYVLVTPEERTLRSHSDLYNVVSDIDQLLGDDTHYHLLAQPNTPFFAIVRYALYPAVPYGPNEANDTGAFIVLARPDITVVNGAIVGKDGPITTGSGVIVQRFDDTSFFFRITRP